MPTYVYETIPTNGSESKTFEFRQSILDPPLTKHPETGEPVRRIITGGAGILSKSDSPSTSHCELGNPAPCGTCCPCS